MPPVRRLVAAVGAAAPVGVLALLAAHCAGYQLAGGHGAPVPAAHHHVEPAVAADHGHLLPVASVSFLLLVVGVLGALVLARRQTRLPGPSLVALLAIQVAGAFVLEGGVPSSRPALVGLLLQVPVALLVHGLCRRALAVVARWGAPRPSRPVRRPRTAPALRGPAPVRRPALHWALAAGRRGPPAAAHA